MSFSGYRTFSKPEVTLFSPETAINFHFKLGKVYIYSDRARNVQKGQFIEKMDELVFYVPPTVFQ